MSITEKRRKPSPDEATRVDKEKTMHFRSRGGKIPPFTVVVLLLSLLVGVHTGLGADPGSLPAHDWNRDNLERIQVPAGDSLTFAVLGDNRSNPAVFKQILQSMHHDPGLTFAIDVGDLVETGTVANFKNFLDQVRQQLSIPFLTAIGNHDLEKDHGAELYRQIFGPDYYAFQIKDNYFIVINDVEKTGVGAEQWDWLEKELKKSQSYNTRLVFLHTPPFDPRRDQKPHALPEEAGRKLTALFRQYHVTHVFAGHIHGYFSGDWQGVPFTITAGAGAPLYGSDPQHFFYHYLKVTLKDGKVDIKVQRLTEKGTP
jgi:serine/threonine-protein phosphatase CPPED1